MTQEHGWADLEASAPELAAGGRALLERYRFVLVGTIRRDGAPRISPVEAHIVNGHLMLVMLPGTHKARDVLRDPRIVLQSPVTDASRPGAEFKLRGRGTELDDQLQREATADFIQAASGWRPARSWRFFSVGVDSAAYVVWAQEEMLLTRWDAARGLRGPDRRRLDMETGSYLPAES